LFLVGDFIDGWQLQRAFRWAPGCSRVLERLHEMVAGGTRMVYVPGNHDDFLRNQSFIRMLTAQLGVLLVDDEYVYETADRRHFLVTHGDRFDVIERSMQWLSKAMTLPYDVLLSLNWMLSQFCSQQDVTPYHLCARGKRHVKRLIRFLSAYENSLLNRARLRDCTGVICGHIHTPAIFVRDGLTYCNTGDWVENCTALLELEDGTLELAHYYPGHEPPIPCRSPACRDPSAGFQRAVCAADRFRSRVSPPPVSVALRSSP
jgi:UDP-2,3-diacylglucosamine pyrophosphatase LpxH